MMISTYTQIQVWPHRGPATWLSAVMVAASMGTALPALAAEPDLARAHQLTAGGKYQGACELPLPFEPAKLADPGFNRLLGEAALKAGAFCAAATR